ncbi:MAG: PEGA domain-containing protein [bacterium]|nr:PEGA domain-containing protein [bacterium]
MDYLDPKKKKAHIRRLYLGYFLMTVAIGLATLILVYIGSGYVPSENGLVQNGMIYVDSSPGEASIKLNGQQQRGSTDARLVLPGATYDIELSKENYRPWARTIVLDDGKVLRVAYPKLYPVSLKTNVVQTISNSPDLVSGSIDRRYILFHYLAEPLKFSILSAEQPYSAALEINIPPNLVNTANADAQYEVIEWTEDSRYILLKRFGTAGNEYFLFDRENVAVVRNLTRDLGLTADVELTLRDRAYNRYLAFSPAAGTVSRIDYENPSQAAVVVNGAIAANGFENNKILYIKPHESDPQKVRVMLLEDSITYNIRELTKSDKYFLEMAKFGRSLVLLCGSTGDKRASVYRNPTNYLRSNPDRTFPLATTTLRIDEPQFASFSTDSSRVVLYGSGQFSSHEFETDKTYNFGIDIPYDNAEELRWMDGARLNIVSDESVYSMDFDGSNLEKLVAARAQYGVYYDRNYENMLSFLVNKEQSLFQLTSTKLIAN